MSILNRAKQCIFLISLCHILGCSSSTSLLEIGFGFCSIEVKGIEAIMKK